MFWDDERTRRAIALSDRGVAHTAIAATFRKETGRPLTRQSVTSQIYRFKRSSAARHEPTGALAGRDVTVDLDRNPRLHLRLERIGAATT